MSGFDIAWLDLRAPADAAARDQGLLRRAAGLLNRRPDPLVIDLGCGTGSVHRALSPHLAQPVRWRLVDHDPVLLAEAARRCPGAETLAFDLGQGIPPLAGATLVTASALVDLVSAAWIEALAETGATLWVTLSYDGRMAWDPAHPLDRAAAAAFNAHQRSDKGFGPALGPDGIGRLEALLRRRGMMVQTAASDWRLGPQDGPLVRALVDGIAAAVLETGQVTAADIAGWHAFRRAAAGTAVIGHRDMFAYSATMG